MESSSIAAWSFKLVRIFGLEIRIHWSWFLPPLYLVILAAGAGVPWWWLPVLVLVPFISVLLHELGHAFMARLVGGEAHEIVMWALGGLAFCEIPSTPGRRFAVAAAGPLVSFLLYAICALVISHGPLPSPSSVLELSGPLWSILAYMAMLNLVLLAFNLLPAFPLDGGAMLRAALWPLLGLRRAVRSTIAIAYVVIIGLMVWSVLHSDLFLFAIALSLLMKVIMEHVALNRGFDPYLGMTEDFAPVSRPWIESWLERRQERRRERDEQAAVAEQATLDLLLAKVSERGLTALTEQERATLQRISKRQRDRQSTAS